MKAIGIAQPTGTGWVIVVFCFLIAWGITYRFIPKVRLFSIEVGWADLPNERRLNREPLPNTGGLAIYMGVMAALVLAGFLNPHVLHKVLAPILGILLGGSVLVLVGFIDDQYGLPPLFRLFVQILCAMLLVAVGVDMDVTLGTPFDNILSVLLTIFWVVGITNAVNLMDGMDGLAGGISFITGMSLLGVSAQFESRAAATIVLAGVAGAALGFLRYNFHPSRIIMGDAGAYFLGYILAATSMLGNLKASTIFSLVPTILFLLVPIVDTTQVFTRRLLAGKNPLSTPGKDHLHHHLLALGLPQRQSAYIVWGITLAANIVAMRLQNTRILAIVATSIGIVTFLCFTVWLRMRALATPLPKPISSVIPESPEEVTTAANGERGTGNGG
jgi:UDP-GlcNAc:undecaprenyl-phosphate GlcNAc-1-phosphate transferase